MSDIGQWLDGLGLGQYRALFAENAIDDTEVLQHLSEQDLRELGVPLGHRKKLLAAIAALATTRTGDRAPTSPARVPASAPQEAERRQLTVMFRRWGRRSGSPCRRERSPPWILFARNHNKAWFEAVIS